MPTITFIQSDTVTFVDSFSASQANILRTLSDTITFADSFSSDDFSAPTLHLADAFTIVDTVVRSISASDAHDENISFGDTEQIILKDFAHRIRWTNYSGVTFPDLYFKDLREPVTMVIHAPSFLQFEYQNSFIVFTRNTINRFVLEAGSEPGEWRALTDNLIEEYSDYGLMESKSLVRAGQVLFFLSEKGVIRWDKDGLRLISRERIDIPDASDFDYVGFYSPINNQYLLHRQVTGGRIYTLSHGSPVFPDAAADVYNSKDGSIKLKDNKFLVYWRDNDTPDITYLQVGNANPNTQVVTYGSKFVVPFGSVDFKFGEAMLLWEANEITDTYKVLITYWNFPTDGFQARSIGFIKIVGNTITLESTFQFTWSSGEWQGTHLQKFNNNDFVLIMRHKQTFTSYVWTGSVVGFGITNFTRESDYTAIIHQFNYLGKLQDNKLWYSFHEQAGGGNSAAIIDWDPGTRTLVWGARSLFRATSTPKYMVRTVHSEKLLAYYQPTTVDLDELHMKIGTVDLDANTIAWGTQFAITKAEYDRFCNVIIVDQSYAIIMKPDSTNSNFGTAQIISLNGTVPVLAPDIEVVFQSAAITVSFDYSGETALEISENTTIGGFLGTVNIIIFSSTATPSQTFVYHIDRDIWTKFEDLDIIDIPVILSGGSFGTNYNLWLNTDAEIQNYPSASDTGNPTEVLTKEYYIGKGIFRKFITDFEGSNVDITALVKRITGDVEQLAGTDQEKSDKKLTVIANKWRRILNTKGKGRSISLKIEKSTKYKRAKIDYDKIGK